MAVLLNQNGSETEVQPKNGKDFKLEELKSFIGGGYIEIVNLGDGVILVIDEEGKLQGLDINPKATALYQMAYGPVDVIVGPALFCKSKEVK